MGSETNEGCLRFIIASSLGLIIGTLWMISLNIQQCRKALERMSPPPAAASPSEAE